MRQSVITEVMRTFVPAGSIEEQWDAPELEEVLRNDWSLDLAVQEMINESNSIDADEILEAVVAAADETYEAKVALVGRESFSAFERSIMLQTLDSRWREHLAALDHLRQGIHLRGYAQKNPKQEYKREAFELFAAMLDSVKQEVTRVVMNVQIQSPEQLEEAAEQYEEKGSHLENVSFQHVDFAEAAARGRGRRRRHRANDQRRRWPTATTPRSRPARRRRSAEGRPQRPLPVRQRQEVQELSRQARIIIDVRFRALKTSDAAMRRLSLQVRFFPAPSELSRKRRRVHSSPCRRRVFNETPAFATFSESRTWPSISPRSIPPTFIPSPASR